MKKKIFFFSYYSFLSSILTYSFISIYLYWLWAVCRRKSLFLLFLWLIFLLSNSIFLSFSVTPLETKTLSTIYLKIIYLNIVEDALFYWNIILFVFRVYIHDRPSYVNVRFVTCFNFILWVYDILSSSFIFSFRFLNFCFVDIFLNRESGGRWLLTDEVSLASWEYSYTKLKITINTFQKLTT